MQKVLITGATGFIGRHCLPILIRNNYEVFAGCHEQKCIENDYINWIKFDIHNLEQTKEIIEEISPTHLLHLAWYTEHGKYVNSVENFKWLNSSLELIRMFVVGGGQRVVTAGTCFEVFTNTIYGTCKASLERISAVYGEQNNISTAHGRIYYLYGPHEDERRVVPYVINQLLKNKQANCSHGEQIRDFLHVSDVANAFVHILCSDARGTIDIGTGKGVKLKKIFKTIEKETGREGLVNLGAVKTSPNEPNKIIAQNSRLFEEVNWRPKYSLEKGMKDTIEWWRSNGAE